MFYIKYTENLTPFILMYLIGKSWLEIEIKTKPWID